MMDIEDLTASGWVGYCQALERYDSTQGAFGAYAMPRIRGAVQDAIKSGKFTRTQWEHYVKVRDYCRSIEYRPTDEEVMRETGLTRQQIENNRRVYLSTQAPYHYNTTESFKETDIHSDGLKPSNYPTTLPTHAQQMILDDAQRVLESALDGIRSKNGAMVLRYIMDGYMHREIAAMMGVSIGRVGQLKKEAIKQVKERLKREDKRRK